MGNHTPNFQTFLPLLRLFKHSLMDQIDVATMTTAFLLLFFLVRARQLWSLGHEQWSEKTPRRLRPRTPEDCPYCGEEHERHCHPLVRVRQQPVPYKERKSRRGRPKEKQTEGHCCWNLRCEYYGIRNADIHALVGDGCHGKSGAYSGLPVPIVWTQGERS